MNQQQLNELKLQPGDRVRIVAEGVVTFHNPAIPYIMLDDGSLWHILPAAVTVERIK